MVCTKIPDSLTSRTSSEGGFGSTDPTRRPSRVSLDSTAESWRPPAKSTRGSSRSGTPATSGMGGAHHLRKPASQDQAGSRSHFDTPTLETFNGRLRQQETLIVIGINDSGRPPTLFLFLPLTDLKSRFFNPHRWWLADQIVIREYPQTDDRSKK